MEKDRKLYPIVRPLGWDLTKIDLSQKNWDILLQLWTKYGNYSPQFSIVEDPTDGECWQIRETVADGEFLMRRSRITMRRNTMKDTYGLLGLSQIDPKNTSVILTEGVSDYFTMKLLHPDANVLGFTTLSGSKLAKKIVASLFDHITVCADNDSLAERNTGILNASNIRTLYESMGKTVNILTPDSSKDVTDELIFSLKLAKYND